MQLRNRTVVVGGGSQGIGLGIARTAARWGAARVILLARRPGPLDEARKQIEALGTECHVWSVDLSVPDRVNEVAEAVRQHCGEPDLVVASSAAGQFLTLRESDLEELHHAMSSTVYAAYNLVQAFVPAMLERDHGHMVLVGSPVRIASFAAVSYKVSRTALYGLAQALRDTFRNTGVGITYVEASRVVDSGYFESNPGVFERLPWIHRHPWFKLTWQRADDVGHQVLTDVRAERFYSAPLMLRVLSRLVGTFGEGLARPLLRGSMSDTNPSAQPASSFDRACDQDPNRVR